MFCKSILPSARTGSVFLFTFSVTNRISSFSITSSMDNRSSYGPVMIERASSRNVMHSFSSPLNLRNPGSVRISGHSRNRDRADDVHGDFGGLPAQPPGEPEGASSAGHQPSPRQTARRRGLEKP